MSIGHREGSPAGERARSPVRVLIVDDAPAFRRVICELLQRRGYQIAGDVSGSRGFVPKADLAGVEFTIFWTPSDRA